MRVLYKNNILIRYVSYNRRRTWNIHSTAVSLSSPNYVIIKLQSYCILKIYSITACFLTPLFYLYSHFSTLLYSTLTSCPTYHFIPNLIHPKSTLLPLQFIPNPLHPKPIHSQSTSLLIKSTSTPLIANRIHLLKY